MSAFKMEFITTSIGNIQAIQASPVVSPKYCFCHDQNVGVSSIGATSQACGRCWDRTGHQVLSMNLLAAAAAAAAKSLQLCLTLCDPIDGSPSGSPDPGILQARTLEWVAISFSNA